MPTPELRMCCNIGHVQSPAGITIIAVDPDPDYLGIELQAWTSRCGGSARIYADVDELLEFAQAIAGFPASPTDSRRYEFGSRDPKSAGGYCELIFRCRDSSGHLEVDVTVEDDGIHYSSSSASLIIQTEPAAVDQFVDSLKQVNRERSGSAVLSATF